jgi:hypothetical protein
MPAKFSDSPLRIASASRRIQIPIEIKAGPQFFGKRVFLACQVFQQHRPQPNGEMDGFDSIERIRAFLGRQPS